MGMEARFMCRSETTDILGSSWGRMRIDIDIIKIAIKISIKI
jgi:hypothetical protein